MVREFVKELERVGRPCENGAVPLFPEALFDDALELRAFSRQYLAPAWEAVEESRSELHRWLWWAQEPMDEVSYGYFLDRQIENFYTDREWRYFIFDQPTKQLLGAASVKLVTTRDVHAAKIGYWVRTSWVRRGVATRTARILTTAAFKYLSSLSLVEIGMDKDNVASARVPMKLGFNLKGEFPKEIRASSHSGRGLLWTMNRALWWRDEARE